MGAWGHGPFDNDDAADWASQFSELDGPAGLAAIFEALHSVAADGYVEAPEGSAAVAAAQVVAHLVAPESTSDTAYGSAALEWATRTGVTADATLIRAARSALDRVAADDSELAELWDEAGPSDWMADLERLRSILAAEA